MQPADKRGVEGAAADRALSSRELAQAAGYPGEQRGTEGSGEEGASLVAEDMATVDHAGVAGGRRGGVPAGGPVAVGGRAELLKADVAVRRVVHYERHRG